MVGREAEPCRTELIRRRRALWWREREGDGQLFLRRHASPPKREEGDEKQRKTYLEEHP